MLHTPGVDHTPHYRKINIIYVQTKDFTDLRACTVNVYALNITLLVTESIFYSNLFFFPDQVGIKLLAFYALKMRPQFPTFYLTWWETDTMENTLSSLFTLEITWLILEVKPVSSIQLKYKLHLVPFAEKLVFLKLNFSF